MMKSKREITRVNLGCIGCLFLMLLLLVLQFTPFWSYGEAGEMSASIGQYIWFPSDHTGLTAEFKATLGSEFEINQVVLWPIVLLVACAAGAVLCLFKQEHYAAPIVSMLAGLAGTIGYLVTPALKLGTAWWLHWVLSLLLLALGATVMYWRIKQNNA